MSYKYQLQNESAGLPVKDPEELEGYLNAFLDISVDPVFIKDGEGKLLVANNAFCELVNVTRKKLIGKTFSDKIYPQELVNLAQSDKQVLDSGKDKVIEQTLKGKGNKVSVLLAKLSRFIDRNNRRFIVGVIRDVTKRRQNELRETTRSEVLELITNGEPLKVVLNAIVSVVELNNPEMMCSILLLDESGIHLRSGTGASLPKFYVDAIDGVEIGSGVGSCGTAAFINERVIVADIQTHPYWKNFKALAERANLGACWSEPIRSTQGAVLGTFAIYHASINYPCDADLALIEQTASLASIAIEKNRFEETLKRAASVFTHANEGIIITDASATIVEVNDTLCRITGYSKSEVLGKNPKILQSGRHAAQFYENMWNTLNTDGNWRGEIWNRRKDGEIYPEMVTISAVKNEEGQVQHYVSLSTDISEIKLNEGKLERIAHYDLLTNLPNRVLLAKRLNQAIKHSQLQQNSLAVAFMDLDGFKAINDNYGHNIGDQFLVEVSSGLKASLRAGDTIARIGGDEFIIIMVNLNEFSDCEHVLNRLLKSASAPVNVADAVMQVSASIGVTVFPQDNVDADQLIRHADQAMYVAKQGGKNRYHQFDLEQDNAINTYNKSIDNVRVALERNEFVLHYQPKVNMSSGEVIGVEALIRWEHPESGLIPPLDFLPVIEGHGVSLQVGEWVIDAALTQIACWQKSGISLPVSVNISAHQLQQDNFTSRLEALLAAHPDVDPGYLELEILETSALQDTFQVSSTMNACHDLGVSFALDDFGTGYSSLTYLKRLPAYLIKIDQSFVRDMLDDTDDLAIVEGVVGLAKTFKRDVIAEGVESVEHGVALVRLGCELAQGYGIAKPMPANKVSQWLTTWEANEAWLALSGNRELA
ncbi:EAL domain-containing protein [Alteromonas stellipolaris]|uniref:Diguanylate cyclase n=1 Tax=Alteromonas stellipolaris TaxID=233316 RepID=A0ABN4LLA6_9ALTE|nr:EAL domain-containing protein [Alteromonas stellipolaris]ALM90947.1 diguanylate cyclase/phosphodiesterase (GGDEF & EAL domains) with PAS/PAC sensor [Alteromonas stellipolaris LMG 21856]AMJ73979.1 diguanylate cyclase [Alteromonas stellipolaris]